MSNMTKLPPQDIEIEKKVLGSMLIEISAVGSAIEVLKKEDFYRNSHQIIFDAISALFNRNEPVDIITLRAELEKRKELNAIGGEVYLMELTEGAMTPAHVKYHSEIIKKKSIARRLINTSTLIINKCYEGADDVNDMLDSAEADIFRISQDYIKQDFSSMKNLLPQTFKDIESFAREGGPHGIASGFNELDEITSGFQKGDLIILAGRPSMGKTAFALSVAANAAIHSSKAIGLFSLEMSKEQLVLRMLCGQARINMHQLRTGKLPHRETAKLSLAAGPLAESRIFIDDSPGIGLHEMRAKARRLKSSNNLDMIIIDYLQLMNPPGKKQSREQEISAISRALKEMAKDLDIPVIALSQLSRRTEQREDGRPKLSDLRESGAIEQDADVVLFIYREKVYNDDAEEGKAEIIVSKQRNGPIGTANLTFLKEYAGFENYSKRVEEEVF